MDLQTCKERLEANGFTVRVFETREAAADYLDAAINGKTVGMGGSMTLAELNAYERLSQHNTVYSHQAGGDPAEQRRLAATADVYLLSANAIAAETGELLKQPGFSIPLRPREGDFRGGAEQGLPGLPRGIPAPQERGSAQERPAAPAEDALRRQGRQVLQLFQPGPDLQRPGGAYEAHARHAHRSHFNQRGSGILITTA